MDLTKDIKRIQLVVIKDYELSGVLIRQNMQNSVTRMSLLWWNGDLITICFVKTVVG